MYRANNALLRAKTAFFGRRTREHGATFDPFDPFDRLPGTMPGTGRAGRLPGTMPWTGRAGKLRASSPGTGRSGRAWRKDRRGEWFSR